MTECQRCGGRATVFLCPRCESHLDRLLRELPWWLERLTETAVGQTRMSDNAGRRSARRRDLDGEQPLAECITQFPDADETDLDKARQARGKAALARALAAGGINARASELLATVADALAYWVRVLCEARGVAYAPDSGANRRSLGSDHAAWLSVNHRAISASPDAGDICGDIESHLDDIVAMVNRPVRIMFLGECPTWIEDAGHACGFRLRAPQDAVETYCRRCRTTHNVNRLLLGQMSDTERRPLSWDELCRINRELPPGFGVPTSTLRHWRNTGLLAPRIAEPPMFAWADVTRLRAKRPQKSATGAAAHQKSD